jgi:flagellar hook-associated protein 3 FlgL
MRSIGDLAAFMLSNRFQANLSNTANTSAQEATTGLAADSARHLGGATMAVSLMDRKSVLLTQHQRSISEAVIFAGTTQTTLAQIQDRTDKVANTLSLVSQLETGSELNTLSETAAGAFENIVNALNSDVAGRYLFAGSATDAQPLPAGAELLSMLRADIAGATTAQDVITAVDAWFDDTGGPYEATAYVGSDTGFMTLPLTADETATFGLRADGDTIRETLKALAKAALATASALGLEITDQKTLMQTSRAGLLAADEMLIEERGSLGVTEAAIENARLSTETELSRLASDRLSLIGIDQFEAASEFEAAQQQLEVFYRVAARQSRTSLAEYLR